mgnify:CR=1 FL=1
MSLELRLTMLKVQSPRGLPSVLLLACALAAATAHAQSYPTRTVRILVPASPGGGSDLQARLLAKRFADSMGQNFVVDNRPGASGVIGAELVARAPADGYTLLMVTNSHAINAGIRKDLRFDPVKDFEAVTLAASCSTRTRFMPCL